MAIRMELSRILIRESVDAHVVELREQDGERVFPIVIGLNEAAAINRRLMGEAPPRPQTHELLANIIQQHHRAGFAVTGPLGFIHRAQYPLALRPLRVPLFQKIR